jgi:hypothetical protein
LPSSILFKYSPKVVSKLVPIHDVRHNKAVKTAILKFWPDPVDCYEPYNPNFNFKQFVGYSGLKKCLQNCNHISISKSNTVSGKEE